MKGVLRGIKGMGKRSSGRWIRPRLTGWVVVVAQGRLRAFSEAKGGARRAPRATDVLGVSCSDDSLHMPHGSRIGA